MELNIGENGTRKDCMKFPHCDPGILHAPEDGCKWCNESGLQDLREVWKINFTGHHDPDKVTCPAERDRPLDSINKWGGNRIANPEHLQVLDDFQKEMEVVIEELTNEYRKRYWGVD